LFKGISAHAAKKQARMFILHGRYKFGTVLIAGGLTG